MYVFNLVGTVPAMLLCCERIHWLGSEMYFDLYFSIHKFCQSWPNLVKAGPSKDERTRLSPPSILRLIPPKTYHPDWHWVGIYQHDGVLSSFLFISFFQSFATKFAWRGSFAHVCTLCSQEVGHTESLGCGSTHDHDIQPYWFFSRRHSLQWMALCKGKETTYFYRWKRKKWHYLATSSTDVIVTFISIVTIILCVVNITAWSRITIYSYSDLGDLICTIDYVPTSILVFASNGWILSQF